MAAPQSYSHSPFLCHLQSEQLLSTIPAKMIYFFAVYIKPSTDDPHLENTEISLFIYLGNESQQVLLIVKHSLTYKILCCEAEQIRVILGMFDIQTTKTLLSFKNGCIKKDPLNKQQNPPLQTKDPTLNKVALEVRNSKHQVKHVDRVQAVTMLCWVMCEDERYIFYRFVKHASSILQMQLWVMVLFKSSLSETFCKLLFLQLINLQLLKLGIFIVATLLIINS